MMTCRHQNTQFCDFQDTVSHVTLLLPEPVDPDWPDSVLSSLYPVAVHGSQRSFTA